VRRLSCAPHSSLERVSSRACCPSGLNPGLDHSEGLHWIEMGKFMILARRAQPIVAGGRAKRRPRCWALDEFFRRDPQVELPCGTRALWDALSARQDNNGRAEPGAPLPLCPRLRWRWSFGPEHKRPNTRAVGLPRNFKLREVPRQHTLTSAATKTGVGFMVVQSRCARQFGWKTTPVWRWSEHQLNFSRVSPHSGGQLCTLRCRSARVIRERATPNEPGVMKPNTGNDKAVRRRLAQLGLLMSRFTSRIWAFPLIVVESVRQRRRQAAVDAAEVERIDRIRNPSDYIGK